MFYRIVRELDDGRLYYRGGAAGEEGAWSEAPEDAQYFESAQQSVRVGAKVAALVEGGKVGVEELDGLPEDSSLWSDSRTV